MADIVIVAKEELTEEDLKGFSMLGKENVRFRWKETS